MAEEFRREGEARGVIKGRTEGILVGRNEGKLEEK